MLNPRMIDAVVQPIPEAGGATQGRAPTEIPLTDFDDAVEAALEGVSEQKDVGNVPVGELSETTSEAPQTSGLLDVMTANPGESLENGALSVSVVTPSMTGEGLSAEMLSAQSSLSPATELKAGSDAAQRLLPLLGGGETVEPALSRMVANGDPRMTAPLEDVHLQASQGPRQSVEIDRLDSMMVTDLLDPEAIEAKADLRQEVLNLVRESGVGAESARISVPESEIKSALGTTRVEGDENLANAKNMMGARPSVDASAPWLEMVETSSEGSHRLPPKETLPAIEHVLLASKGGSLAGTSVGTEGAAAKIGANLPVEEQAPWARSLVDGHYQPGLDSEPRAAESDGEPVIEKASALQDAVKGGTRSTFSQLAKTSQVVTPTQSTSDVGTAFVPTPEAEPQRVTESVRLPTNTPAMSAEAAMATDDVAEFTVVKPDRMDVRIQDIRGDLELSVARDEDGLAVKIRAPSEVLEDFQNMESDVESALAEEDHELASFDAEANDSESEESMSPEVEEAENANGSNVLEGRGARVLSRMA